MNEELKEDICKAIRGGSLDTVKMLLSMTDPKVVNPNEFIFYSAIWKRLEMLNFFCENSRSYRFTPKDIDYMRHSFNLGTTMGKYEMMLEIQKHDYIAVINLLFDIWDNPMEDIVENGRSENIMYVLNTWDFTGYTNGFGKRCLEEYKDTVLKRELQNKDDIIDKINSLLVSIEDQATAAILSNNTFSS